MYYVIDAHARPQLIVVVTDDLEVVERTAQLYSNQSGHPIVVAEGPSPGEAQYTPLIPELAAG